MSVSSELNGENVPALGSSVKVGPTMLQVMHKQNLLLEQSNKQSKMTFDLLSLMLAQLKSQSATSTTAGSSLKRSRTENEADGVHGDQAHSEKKQAVSSSFSPTWSLLNHLLTPGLSANLFSLPHASAGQLFAQHFAVHSPCSPIPLMALDCDRDLEAERNKYFMAHA